MYFHVPRFPQKEMNSDPGTGVFYTFVVTVHRAGVITSFSEFFTHFCELILQGLLMPICFAHLIGNLAFILIASQSNVGTVRLYHEVKELNLLKWHLKGFLTAEGKKMRNER